MGQMSRSTRSSTRIQEGKNPAGSIAKSPARTRVSPDPISDAISTINSLIASFIDSATEVQMAISSAKKEDSLLNLIGADREGFENLCMQVTQINNQHRNCQTLMKAVQHWHQFLLDHPMSTLVKLDAKKRRDVCSAGRSIASSLLITGNIYLGLNILKDIIEINDYDPPSSVILLRWLVRYCEWEAMEKFLESDRMKKKSSFEGFEELVELCGDILEFHRMPKGREDKAIKLMKKCRELNEAKDKTFQLFEAQVLVYSALFLVSKVAGIKAANVMDPLYCIDLAFQRAEVVTKSRWAGVWFDKPMDGLKAKAENSVEYLKVASAVAEYFDVLRMNVNEYTRCGILREPSQISSLGLCIAMKLGFPVWITQSFTLILSTRLRSEAEKDEVNNVKKFVSCIFMKEGDVKKNQKKEEEISCITQITNKLSSSSEKGIPHIPFASCASSSYSSPSSRCNCYLCLENSFNPTMAFFSSKLWLICSDYSIDAITSLVTNYTQIRSVFAPLQQKLMNMAADKPRAPSWICDEMGQSIVSFLISPIGLSMDRKDARRIELLNVANRICSYSTHLCLPYKLLLRHLSRKGRDSLSFPWMSRRSIITKLADLSIGSEGRGRITSSRSPFTPRSINTPNRINSAARKVERCGEDEEEGNEFLTLGHLLYHDWRSRVCEQQCLKWEDPWKKAFYLSETVAVATREARRLIDGKIEPFGFKTVEEFKRAVAKIPQEMTVNELLVTMSGDLYLVKIHSKRTPIVIPLAREKKWSSIMDGFTRAMNKSDESAKAGKESCDAKKYWEGRRKAEDMMRRAMIDMESDLLGAFAPLLLPSRKLTKKGELMVNRIRREEMGAIRDDMAREMISIGYQTAYDDYKQLIECMGILENWNRQQMDRLLRLHKELVMGVGYIEECNELPFVFFVLSTELSRSPWEAVSILEKKAHCSRLISIHQLFSLLNSFNKIPHSANPLSAFYILDPANDLAATKNRLTPVVEKVPSWKGVTGKGPEKDQVASIISHNDFLIFLGHGNGLRYMSRSIIRKSRCRAVVLLMGCSSVHTIHEGRGMDGKGAVLDYSVASCPCIVGCIYTVTDGEIDRYFTALFEEGLARHLKHPEDSTPYSELRLHLDAMAKARAKVKLPYLTGSTVVSYGIPIDIRAQH